MVSMSSQQTSPTGCERRFDIEELFFSTTDKYGVIVSGNDVFRRIAAYDSVDELIGKPHNIIRHPDMPRAVFYALWQYLQSGKSIAAYVKNLAKDGCYYWVLAFVMPSPCGYISVRLKPSTEILKTVEKLYKQMLAIEQEARIPAERAPKMADSFDFLEKQIKTLGFASYDEFMHMAMTSEASARFKAVSSKQLSCLETSLLHSQDLGLRDDLSRFLRLNTELDQLLAKAETFIANIGQLSEKSRYLERLAQDVHLLSLNAIISSHRLADAGRSLAVITHSLAQISSRSNEVISELTRNLHALISGLRETGYHISAAKLQAEMSAIFLSESIEAHIKNSSEPDMVKMRSDLLQLEVSFEASCRDLGQSVKRVSLPLRQLSRHISDLESVLKTLSNAHVLGKIEVAHIKDSVHFQTVFAEVNSHVTIAKREVTEFQDAIRAVSQAVPLFERFNASQSTDHIPIAA